MFGRVISEGNLGSDLGKSVYINYLVSTEACFCVLKPPFSLAVLRCLHSKLLIKEAAVLLSKWAL